MVPPLAAANLLSLTLSLLIVFFNTQMMILVMVMVVVVNGVVFGASKELRIRR